MAVLLCALVLTTAIMGQTRSAWAVTQGAAGHVADSSTADGYQSILGTTDEEGKEVSSTRYAGRVWTDKSVTTEPTVTFTGTGDSGTETNNFSFTRSDEGDFLVTYSALATSQQITQLPKIPVDVVFVLDFSGSMNWGTRAQEVVGQGNQGGLANSRLLAMVNALNDSIDTLVQDNENNRIGIAVFNGTAMTLLPLTQVSEFGNVQNGQYLEITDFDRYTSDSGKQEANATVQCNINNESADTAGGTNIQAGMEQGMSMLAGASSTLYEYEGEQYTRIPNVVLMSDGAPTSWSPTSNTKWKPVDEWGQVTGTLIRDNGNARYNVDSDEPTYAGNWWDQLEANQIIGRGDTSNPHSADGFMALLTASYKKNQITRHYSDNARTQDVPNEEDAYCRVYNIGFSTDQQTPEMQEMVDIVLNPAEHLSGQSNVEEISRLRNACEEYLSDNGDVTVYGELGNNAGSYKYIVSHPNGSDPYDPTSFNYPDEYYSAQNADDLNNAFQQITSAITDSAKVPTQVSGSDPFHGGYVTYTDPIGEYMQVKQINGLLFANQQFKVDGNPTSIEGGVRYRLTNVDGSGSTVNSELYGSHDVNNILIEVLTDSSTGKQTLKVQIPAALIPLRVSYVEVNSDGTVQSNKTNNVYPLRLVYEVGVAGGVVNEEGELKVGDSFNGSYNSESKSYNGVSEDYASTHKVDSSGEVGFYANLYSGNEQVDGETTCTVGDATVEFTAAKDNPFYFIQEDTPLYMGENGERAIGQIEPGETYWFKISYYEGMGTKAKERWISRSGSMLQGWVDSDSEGRLYIREGAPRLGNLVDMEESVLEGYKNNTGTANHPYYPTAENAENGTFKVYLGNNGRLSVSLPGPDVQPALQVTKVNASNGQATLPDATFAVYEDTNNIDGYNEGDTQLGEALKTGSNGVITFEPEAHTFELGKTYFLVETDAPDGYQLMSGAVSIVFNENDGSDTDYPAEEHPFVATVTFPGETSATQYSGPASTGDNPVATVALTVADQPVPSLPQTGGNGRITTAVAGTALVALAGYAIWNKRVRTSHH